MQLPEQAPTTTISPCIFAETARPGSRVMFAFAISPQPSYLAGRFKPIIA
jgi:hypothetical protein